jgi:pyrophosphate--fructose-6-phosphate 1-phosphotransferase
MVDLAVESALNKVSGVTGHDEDQNGKLRTIEFPRIKGGKHFDMTAKWFGEVMDVIGQPFEAA